MTEIDVVIISWAKDKDLHNVTKRGIETLLESSLGEVKFNIVVVESNRDINYDEYNRGVHSCKTIYPKGEFNYNGYLNQGIKLGKAEFVALCNSDLTYERGWAEEIIKVMRAYPEFKSSSPWCPQVHGDNTQHIGKVYVGHEVRKEFCGWCIVQQRSLYETIGKLNEEVKFWFSDNILAAELQLRGIDHVLMPTSVVNHHDKTVGKTAEVLSDQKKLEYTVQQQGDFVKAYNKLLKKINKV